MRAFSFALLSAVVCSGVGPADAAVVISDDVDEGRPAFRITTDVATYFYSKAGASLTSLVDVEGIDWINFHPEGTPDLVDGSFGWFRGVPNMTRQGFGHAAGEGATSVTFDPLDQPLDKVTIVSTEGGWESRWEFFPTFARMTVTSAAADYWLLYEGTPGGELDPADLCWAAGDQPAPCARKWRGDIQPKPQVAPGLEWMVLGDPALDRSLIVLHNDDSIVDQHRLMDGMTVFGFGRADPGRLYKALHRIGLGEITNSGRIQQSIDTLLITFAEAVQADLVEDHIRSLTLHPDFGVEP
ncbi:MAG: hypothetical protein R3349_04200, partial [Geminicoccaceae bacterium]|nr:hypothetical protein [Geminicoccaceae bacterium]